MLSFKQETEQALEKDTYTSNVDTTVSGLQQICSAGNTNTPGRQYHTNHTSSEIVLQSLSNHLCGGIIWYIIVLSNSSSALLHNYMSQVALP
jgi:hypothetical protein